MTRFYILRHGESVANLSGLFVGNTDVELTERGKQQAVLASQYFNKIKFDKAYASDLSRAYKTAQLALGNSIDIVPTPNLREINGGEWENKNFSRLVEEYPDEYGLWISDIGRCVCVGGESFSDLYQRVTGELMKIASLHPNQTIFIATHGAVIKCLICKAKGYDVKDLCKIGWVANASISVIDVKKDKFALIDENNCEHLGNLVTVLPKDC